MNSSLRVQILSFRILIRKFDKQIMGLNNREAVLSFRRKGLKLRTIVSNFPFLALKFKRFVLGVRLNDVQSGE